MPLFQKSVLNKFLKAQDQNVISKAYKKFSKHFHNSIIQENIRNSKEEQYQEGFLRELFVDVFGYVLNPQPNFNLSTEFKNEKGAKKADGAIFKHGKALGVIELKGTDTKDLEKVRQQAFDYKANQSACVYVITSNFEKLRFYINNAVEFEEFDLFTLTEKQFELLYLCLAAENLLEHVPLKIKEASVVEEENITKKFYADYSLFKRELFRDLVKKNLRNDVFRGQLLTEETSKADKNIKLLLFKKSQKLIDRFLFIFFAEDRGLLPPNSTHRILDDWNKLKDLDAAVPLYDRFKLYFNFLDTGRKGTAEKAEIFAYNGGLFKPDGTLDSLKIDDELLYKHTKALASYDFESQVDVNILGHIFENSLNEIESVNAEIEGTDFDKQKTKRKKDGVFYTPKYITKYIVDNTVGKLCTEKRAALGIIDEEFTKNRQKETKKKLLEKLDEYRAWLLELTICDPACGSGAFLNQALDFLINEHRSVDELQASLLGGSLVFQEIENTILEKNIYGVDLNEESVEIAKLSLWLRTAQPRRKLNDLNNNIKCGNSLIESKAVAGDKAFKWEEEFPEVFARGGFDVVVGNPPYVSKHFGTVEKAFYNSKFETAQYQLDLYISFMELGIIKLNPEGVISYIVPNSWLKNLNFDKCRKFILDKLWLVSIIPNLDNVFSDASVDTMIFCGKKDVGLNENIEIGKFIQADYNYKHDVNQKRFYDNEKFIFDVEISKSSESIFKKIADKSIYLENVSEITRGINPYDKYRGQSAEIIANQMYHAEYEKDETFVPEIRGRHVNRYSIDWDGKSYVSYGEWLAAPREPKFFDGPRIICRQVLGENLNCTYLDSKFIIDQSVFIARFSKEQVDSFDPKFVLAQLTSKLVGYYFRFKANEFDALFPKIKIGEYRQLPIKTLNKTEQKDFVINVDLIIAKTEALLNIQKKFKNYFQSQFQLEILSKKLQSWHDLTFSEFINELNKAIKSAGGTKLSKLQEMEWMEVFETKQKEALALKAEIERVDKEIDQMVYALYGLTEEEIGIVEKN